MAQSEAAHSPCEACASSATGSQQPIPYQPSFYTPVEADSTSELGRQTQPHPHQACTDSDVLRQQAQQSGRAGEAHRLRSITYTEVPQVDQRYRSLHTKSETTYSSYGRHRDTLSAEPAVASAETRSNSALPIIP
jgi:hypothetical protein